MKFLNQPQSGSYQGLTSSRNRFGQYFRTRATPVNPRTTFQTAVRGTFATLSATWRTLTDEVKAGWNSLGLQMSRKDSLGSQYNLTGQEAYVSVNSNLVNAGQTTLGTAPSLSTPDAVVIGDITVNSGTLTVAFTPTPVGANETVNLYGSPQRSPGVSFEKDLRLLMSGTLAQTGTLSAIGSYTARFGAPVTGNKIFFGLERVNTSGFKSTISTAAAIVG